MPNKRPSFAYTPRVSLVYWCVFMLLYCSIACNTDCFARYLQTTGLFYSHDACDTTSSRVVRCLLAPLSTMNKPSRDVSNLFCIFLVMSVDRLLRWGAGLLRRSRRRPTPRTSTNSLALHLTSSTTCRPDGSSGGPRVRPPHLYPTLSRSRTSPRS